jgi:regulatory protein
VAKITALHFSKGHRKKVNISLDEKQAFSLAIDLVISEKLKIGQEISTSQIANLKKVSYQQSCYEAATRLLSYRLRSEDEMKRRLNKLGFNTDTVKAVQIRLKAQGLLDDNNFARFWRDNRISFNPRSRCLIKVELRQKGVPNEIIDQVINDIDDENNAYKAAQKKADKITITDYQDFRRRLGGYLKNRGYNYRVIIKTIDHLWEERKESQKAEIV